jgi:hypothetical protein
MWWNMVFLYDHKYKWHLLHADAIFITRSQEIPSGLHKEKVILEVILQLAGYHAPQVYFWGYYGLQGEVQEGTHLSTGGNSLEVSQNVGGIQTGCCSMKIPKTIGHFLWSSNLWRMVLLWFPTNHTVRALHHVISTSFHRQRTSWRAWPITSRLWQGFKWLQRLCCR